MGRVVKTVKLVVDSFGSFLSQNRRALAKYIRMTCEALLEGNVPEHEQGETFHSFRDLMIARWFRVRRLRHYEAGVVYGR